MAPSICSSCVRWSKAKTRISGPVPVPVGRPVDLLELGVVAQVLADDTALEEELQLRQRGIGRRAAVARDGEGPAGVGVFQRGRPVLVRRASP